MVLSLILTFWRKEKESRETFVPTPGYFTTPKACGIKLSTSLLAAGAETLLQKFGLDVSVHSGGHQSSTEKRMGRPHQVVKA